MTLAKEDMIQRFLDGEESGSASREEIDVVEGWRCIIGYGWAVYAADLGEKFALFGDGYKSKGTDVGWAGYSGQTTQHLQEIKAALETGGHEYVVVDQAVTKLEIGNRTHTPAEAAEKNQVEKRETTGYLYRQ
jgi:hypothetical protein